LPRSSERGLFMGSFPALANMMAKAEYLCFLIPALKSGAITDFSV
jgi:hypothetical protein